ncbi:MAG: DUF1922 domain-containing protein [Candidatus Heimdallarchaeota archaeon]|nr:DUF1922 domain-containing protein [Candidatus Heimdallarchaeota archaeon]
MSTLSGLASIIFPFYFYMVTTMSEKKFIVIRCPRCGKWTYARSRQKSRFCSRCERSFKIDPVKVIYAKSHREASFLVKLKNAEAMKSDFK